MPSLIRRRRVGWPTSRQANGEWESISALVSSRSSSSWSAVEQVGFVEDEDDGAAAFVFLGGEQVDGLRDQRGLVEAGDAAEGGDDAGVEAAAADGGVAEVDDGVPAGVEAGEGGADGDGLAGADLAGDHAEAAFA